MTNNHSDNTTDSAALSDSTRVKSSDKADMDTLSQYLKSSASTRQGRSIPPLENWHPEQTIDMDLVIKANGEWWHEGSPVTRQSLVDLFATVLWIEDSDGKTEYFLKSPEQKLRIQVEDVPLFINDVGIVQEEGVSWLEFTTSTGDVVRLDESHPITLRTYHPDTAYKQKSDFQDTNKLGVNNKETTTQAVEQVRPYMLVRNGLMALIGRNAFYHLTEIGELAEQDGEVVLTLMSGGKSYALTMPDS